MLESSGVCKWAWPYPADSGASRDEGVLSHGYAYERKPKLVQCHLENNWYVRSEMQFIPVFERISSKSCKVKTPEGET